MVLYGQSAGANAVNAYAYANPVDPIIKGLIISSSSTPATNPTSSTLFHDLAQNAGCAGLNATAELACMQQLDALVLQQKVDEANPDPFRGLFRPITDNVTMFANVTARLEQGLVANIVGAPEMRGWNCSEADFTSLCSP
jgi:carboxylesterase type B